MICMQSNPNLLVHYAGRFESSIVQRFLSSLAGRVSGLGLTLLNVFGASEWYNGSADSITLSMNINHTAEFIRELRCGRRAQTK